MKRTNLPGSPVRAGRSEVPTGDYQRLLGIGDVHLGADNVVSALEYYERALALARESQATDSETLEIEIRIIDALVKRGRHQDALGLVEDLLSRQDASRDRRSYARVLARLGAVQGTLHRYAEAQSSCERAYEILKLTDANQEVAFLELTLGVVAHYTGRLEDARRYYESALSTFRRIDDSEGIARALNNLGTLLITTPRWGEGKEFLARAVSVAEEAGNYARIASLCLNLGILSYETGEWALASSYLSRALAISKETAPSRMIRAHIALGHMKLRMRDFAAAESHFLQILQAARDGGYPREEALALEFLGERALREGEFDVAADYFRRSMEIAKTVAPANDVIGELETRMAELALAEGRPAEARSRAVAALAICSGVQDSIESGRALRLRGEAELALGRSEEARLSLEEAVRVLEGTPDAIEQELARVSRARCWAEVDLADHSSARGASRAAISLEQSCQRFLELSLPELAIECLSVAAAMADRAGAVDDALATVDRALDLAERHGVTRRRHALLDQRASLEERFAETSLSRSLESQILGDVSTFGFDAAEGSVDAFLSLVAGRTGSQRVLLAVRAKGEGTRVEGSWGFDGALPGKAVLASLFAQIDRGSRVLVIGDPARDPRFPFTQEFAAAVSSAAAIPLQLVGEDLGLLYADRSPTSSDGRFRIGDLRLLSFFAGILSVFLSARESERRARRGLSGGEVEPKDALTQFLTCNAELKRSLRLLRKLDRSDAGVLITGETGTGKGLLSRLIHESGQRSKGPFVPINCAALPESLLESELFGHEQGAFTGALRSKRGLFEEAEGGTLFLDEVDKAPLAVQAKLLHVLDRHEIRPVGSTQWKPVDVRVVCATNVDLRQAIESGRFLEDLYYRLNDFQVHIPPLRERREDIPMLVRHFVDEFRRSLGRDNVTLTRAAVEVLTDHDWRGNVRELEKVVKRVLVLAEDGEQVDIDALPREIRMAQRAPSAAGRAETLRRSVERLEAEVIGSALEASGGNKSEVARRLQISYPSLLAKIRKYGLEPRRR